ncbi:protein ACCELERATED CELL DEATH 6-like [Syzygium oleosum]|uniref:protein ACCELERATED CELL DEATH 6-like n=1 Tax=Syzygium oleosum TaxID=219896 RepID=UPI0024B9A920|nr:protein ACCELERATED CELL DEATH 6-like [Syzygium oleosum]
MDVQIPMNMDEEDIRRSQQARIKSALVVARIAARQEPKDLYADARGLVDVIKAADVEKFISMIERHAVQTDPSAIFNFQGLSKGSLLHIAAGTGKDDILRLLIDCVGYDLIAAPNDWGDTPLHMAAKAGGSGAALMLIRRERDLPSIKDNKMILRMKNKHGNTALHEAVLHCHADVVCHLLREDLEPVYWENMEQKSPLYLALDTNDSQIHEALFLASIEPSRIQGLPPVHGAVLRGKDALLKKILGQNMQLFAMTDSKGGNVFHLAAYMNQTKVFEFLGPQTEYLARETDMSGDLPIHIAAKMGYVDLIHKLHPVSNLLNGQGQTVLHVAVKYGRTSAVRYILSHLELGKLINERDHAGNTPLHLAAMHSQPAALIPLVLDQRINPFLQNRKCLAAHNIALYRFKKEPTLRKQLTLMVANSTIGKSPNERRDLFVLRPEARDEEFSIYSLNKSKQNKDQVKDLINTRLLLATLVATVTFAAGFAVPGGFNGSDMASEDDRGMATMLDKRLFQAFTICNTIAMFCSMTAVINLIYAQQKDVQAAIAANRHSVLPLTIALPAMSVAFLTGVTLTVGKLPWLAYSIFYLGLVFLLIISGATLIEYPPLLKRYCHPIRRPVFWLVLAYIYLWGVETYLLDDLEDDGTTSGTSASRPSNGVGDRMTDDSVTAKCGDTPHPPSH